MDRHFAVSAYIVSKSKVLLIRHSKLGAWLPIGGHIEPGEDPETTLKREVKEETGLEVKIVSESINITAETMRLSARPEAVFIEQVAEGHEHVDFVYFCVPNNNALKKDNRLKWFSLEELDHHEFIGVVGNVAKLAIQRIAWYYQDRNLSYQN